MGNAATNTADDYGRYMQRYGDWGPTPFDARGLAGEQYDISDWYVFPVLVTRDTPEASLAASNFAVAEKEFERVDPDGEGWEKHGFNHWGPGWFDIILVKPGTAAADMALEFCRALEDYPVLDESDWSERRFNAVCEYWAQCSIRERVEYCRDAGVSVFGARSNNPYGCETDYNGCLIEALEMAVTE